MRAEVAPACPGPAIARDPSAGLRKIMTPSHSGCATYRFGPGPMICWRIAPDRWHGPATVDLRPGRALIVVEAISAVPTGAGRTC
jgi:hypothetical protein